MASQKKNSLNKKIAFIHGISIHDFYSPSQKHNIFYQSIQRKVSLSQIVKEGYIYIHKLSYFSLSTKEKKVQSYYKKITLHGKSYGIYKLKSKVEIEQLIKLNISASPFPYLVCSCY